MTDVFGSQTPELVDPIAYAKERFKNDAGEIDLEKLARGKLEGDLHAKRLEKENEELRGEVKTRIGLEEFLTKINSSPALSTPNSQSNQPPANEQAPIDVERLVEETFSKAEASRTKAANRAVVNDVLTKAWGSDATKNLGEVAVQLGMSKEELTALAERSPQAFFRITGVSTNPSTPAVGSVPQSTLRFGTEQNNERNHSYYQKLKKTDPNLYFSTKVQVQMHEDANRLGQEKFFN